MKEAIRILFMGTPEFAVPSLEVLLEEGYNVVGVVTQPDRPKGRKRVLTPPPVKEAAMKAGLPVYQPERMRKEEAAAGVAEFKPDLIVTAAYGQILPKTVLHLPRLGCINVHASLLPKYRGGAPIHHAIMQGEAVTGVTIMYMEEGLDTGDMISKVEVPILDEDNTGTLFHKLSVEGAELLRRTLPALIAGEVQAVPQNHSEATLAPNIKREDETINWNRGAREIFNHIRGLSPWPVACTTWNGENFKVWGASPPASSNDEAPVGPKGQEPGTVLQITDQGIQVAASEGTIWLTEVQPAGKKVMPVSEFRKGTTLTPGTILGN